MLTFLKGKRQSFHTSLPLCPAASAEQHACVVLGDTQCPLLPGGPSAHSRRAWLFRNRQEEVQLKSREKGCVSCALGKAIRASSTERGRETQIFERPVNMAARSQPDPRCWSRS